MAQTSKDCFFNIEQILCKMSAQKLSLFAATLAINSEQIKDKSRRDLKYVITKTLEEKLDDEERTEEQKCEVFKQILEDLNFYNDETNTGSSNQPKKDSTQKHVSLIHQINEAQEAGYDESEIVNSVIRAMSPSLTLRNVLETTSNLSLQRLLQFLESHFEEKSATDLCGKLTSMILLPEESEYSYVMKCIEVRQKVLLASSKSDIKYDKGLVMKLFYRTLERGLLSSYVVQEIKPLLRSSVSDEDLITAVRQQHLRKRGIWH